MRALYIIAATVVSVSALCACTQQSGTNSFGDEGCPSPPVSVYENTGIDSVTGAATIAVDGVDTNVVVAIAQPEQIDALATCYLYPASMYNTWNREIGPGAPVSQTPDFFFAMDCFGAKSSIELKGTFTGDAAGNWQSSLTGGCDGANITATVSLVGTVGDFLPLPANVSASPTPATAPDFVREYAVHIEPTNGATPSCSPALSATMDFTVRWTAANFEITSGRPACGL